MQPKKKKKERKKINKYILKIPTGNRYLLEYTMNTQMNNNDRRKSEKKKRNKDMMRKFIERETAKVTNSLGQRLSNSSPISISSFLWHTGAPGISLAQGM